MDSRTLVRFASIQCTKSNTALALAMWQALPDGFVLVPPEDQRIFHVLKLTNEILAFNDIIVRLSR